MKQYAMLHRCLTLAALAVALFVLVPDAPAQNRTSVPAARQQQSPTDAIDLKVQGTTVGHVVEVLREKFPNANFVLGSGVAQILVKDLNLHQMDIEGVLEALKYATDGQVAATSIPGGWAIRGRPERRQVEAFNLNGYLQSLGSNDQKTVQAGVEKVYGIIYSSVEMLIDRGLTSIEKPGIQFHQGANLLVVVGSPEAIDVARKVVNALPGQQPSLNQVLPEIPAPAKATSP